MGELFGFGSPEVTLIWALACLIAFAWLGWQLISRRLVTIPSFVVSWSFLAPILVQYPFTFSPANTLATGIEAFTLYPAHLDSALLISLSGMLAFVLGFLLPRRVPETFAPAHFVSAGMRIWGHSGFIYVSSLINLSLFIVMFFLGLIGAEGARHQAQLMPALRPLFNFAQTLLPITTALALAVGWQRRRYVILMLAVGNIALGVLAGTRGAALGGVMFFALAVLCQRSLTTGLSAGMIFRAIAIGGILLLLAVYLGDVRAGRYNPILSVLGIGARVFYGNNFSDLRDFAWVRAYWNGGYLWGRTELAGMLSFIPSYVSPFRSEWNWGVVSTRWTGFDPAVHPGLRPGIFGELYFNFGVAGVLVGGLFYGYVARRLHAFTQRAARLSNRHAATLQILAAFVTLSIASTFLHTPGFFGVYVIGLTLCALQVGALAVRPRSTPASTDTFAPSQP